MRGCSCRGTAGFAHVSCLAEEAKVLVAEAEENNLGDEGLLERARRWHTCGLCDQNLGLLRQARHVRKTCRAAARTPAHKALLRFPMEGLRADVARLALRVVRALRDRDRDGLLVFFVGVILLRVAAAVYFLAHLLMAAAPVVVLARRVKVSCVASNASRRGVGQWGGAGGAVCEDHFGG